MKTITIPDPIEVLEALCAEFHTGRHTSIASFGDEHLWRLTIYKGGNHFTAQGQTPEDAMQNLRDKVTASDPLEKAREVAAANGLKLVPADQ